MERFFWREAPTRPLENRFPDGVVGFRAWQQLVRRIYEEGLIADQELPVYVWNSLWNEFINEIDKEQNRISQDCCLFVSHRRSDVSNALHVAWIATQEGYDYWLDVHNPILVSLAGKKLPRAVMSILIAAIVEIALLNVTHVIALHTQRSAGSAWIPYEFGRAKERLLHSNQAASWFNRKTSPSSCGEYVYLAVQTKTGDQIRDWLRKSRNNLCKSSVAKTWHHKDPPPLD